MTDLLQPVDKAAIQTEKDKLSYSLGINIGKQMKSDNLDVDLLRYVKGFQDGRTGSAETALMTEAEIAETMSGLQKQLLAAAKEQQKKAAEDANLKSQRFLEENKGKEGVVTTESGLQYKVLQEGDGPVPALTDQVESITPAS